MTNEDYVTYETAQALKKAGFYWPCKYYYTKDNAKDKNVWLTFTLCGEEDFNKENKIRRSLGICSAPSLAQTQKWLRGKKRWHVEVRINGCRNMFCVELWEMVQNGGYLMLEHKDGHAMLFDTYESALAAGISAALSLL